MVDSRSIHGRFTVDSRLIRGSRSNLAESRGGAAEGGVLCSLAHAGHVLSSGILLQRERRSAPGASSTVTTCLLMCHDPTCKYDGKPLPAGFSKPVRTSIPPFDLLFRFPGPSKSSYSSSACPLYPSSPQTRRTAAGFRFLLEIVNAIANCPQLLWVWAINAYARELLGLGHGHASIKFYLICYLRH